MSKKQDNIDFTNELKYSLDIMHEQSKFAETKNASMIVFTSALFIGILSNIDAIRKLLLFENTKLLVFKENAYKTFIILFLLTLVFSFIISIISFIPKIRQKSVERGSFHNILFFDENTIFDSSEQLGEYYSEKYKDISLYNKDLANQIYNLSKIANRKYKFFKFSAWILVFGFILSIIVSFIVWCV